MAVQNNGRLINFISGINGVSAGGQATVNLPCNNRVHRNIFQCAAVNYTGGTALVTTTLTGVGVSATVTPTVVNGVITAAAVVAGGSGYVVGDTITVQDATGQGAILRVATLAGSAIATLTVTSGGSASPINPVSMVTSVRESVNGVVIRDINPQSIISIAQANGLIPRLGELPLLYTEPYTNQLVNAEALSWDLFGQSTYQIQMGINGSVSSPSLTGITEFDYFRNTRPGANGKPVLSLQPVAKHAFNFNVSGGRNAINTLPINYPIRRLWIVGSIPGVITQLEIYQDKNKIAEMTVGGIGSVTNPTGNIGQMNEAYGEYGFQFGQANFANQNYAGTGTVNKALQASINPLSYFDAAYLSDPDGRYWKALKCESELLVVVYSAVAQTITIVQESLPGAYRA